MMVRLRGGLWVAEAAVRLAVDLEARGFTLTADAGQLRVRPAARLTPADASAIKRLRNHLLAIAAYVPPEDGHAAASDGRTGRRRMG